MNYSIFKDTNKESDISEIIKSKLNECKKDNKDLEKAQVNSLKDIKVSTKNGKLLSGKTSYNIDEDSENDAETSEESLNQDLTKDIKLVFQEAKGEQEKIESQQSSKSLEFSKTSSFYSISETIHHEFKRFRSGKEIRNNYLASLVSKNIWKPNIPAKKSNSIFIFDWDDTLLPTSFLSPGGIFNIDLQLTRSDREKLKKIEKEVFNLLNSSISKGDVYIITNADKGWVEFSINKIYPSLLTIIPKIKIISAREKYGHIFPGNFQKWKIEAFLELLTNFNLNLITNLICVGDSFFEIEAGKILASKFREAFIKTIKFKETPKLNDLLKELTIVNTKFNFIYSTVRNMKIKITKRMN